MRVLVASDLVGLDGEPLRQENVKRRRMETLNKKTTPKGDVLFKLIVDCPKELGEDDFNRVMVEYFGIGFESFKGRL
jgi:hypothetical protein